MATKRGRKRAELILRADEPLLAASLEQDGRHLVRYFAEDGGEAPDTTEGITAALELAGAWGDLDWDDAAAELARIRHESRPTPPILDL